MPALLQTGRNTFVNMRPEYGRARGGLVEPGDAGGGLYALRHQGEALRDQYSEAATEAAALTRQAPSSQEVAPGQAAGIRDAAMGAAHAQTLTHFQIRRDLANDASRDALAHEQNVRDWAQLALNGQLHLARLGLEKAQLGLDERKLLQQGDYQQGQLDLSREELSARKEDSVADRALRERQFNENAKNDRQRIGLEEKKMAQDKALDERKIEIDQQNADTAAGKGGPRVLRPGWVMNRANKLGIDTSGFINKDDAGGGRNQRGNDFVDVAVQLKAENPDWDNDRVIQAAAENMGVGKKGSGGGLADAGAGDANAGAPPPAPKRSAPAGYKWVMVQGPNGWEAELQEA